MKPGDLVEIIDYGGYYSTDPPRIGLLIKTDEWSPITFNLCAHILVDGNVERHLIRDIRPLVNPDDGGYDDTKETT